MVRPRPARTWHLPGRGRRGVAAPVSAAAEAADRHGGAARLPAVRAGGAVFAGPIAVCILARQGLLALRAGPRRWPLAGPVTLAAAAAPLLAGIAVAALR